MENLFQDNYEASFDALSFERKLVELVEELRLRRDEFRRSYAREKAEFEQQITLLKRKLDDKLCVSDDEKAKQLVVSKTYSQEIRVLKEELRSSHSEKLKLVKRIQELEGQLKLHNNFQETIVKQISETRSRLKVLAEECVELKKFQEGLRNNVSEIHTNFSKFDVCYNHLREAVSLAEKRNETLKKEIISSKAEITVLKSIEMQIDETTEKKENILEKTLKNLAESNKHLCKYMDKYNDGQALEKTLQLKIEKYEKDEEDWKMNIDEIQKELISLKAENSSLKEKLTVEIKPSSTETQENNIFNENLPNDASNPENKNNEDSKPTTDPHNETSKSELKEVETHNMLKTVSSFCELAKRKFDAMEEEEEDSNSIPFKRPNTGESRDWKNRHNPLFVEEVSSSIEDISLSQEEESQDIANDGDTSKVQEGEMKDLASVQMNLRELKMNDGEKDRVVEDEEKDK